MAQIAGIGVGLFILAFIWVFTIFLFLVFSRAQGAVANLGIGLMILSLIVTLTLIFLPRGPVEEGNRFVIYDNYVIGRTVLVTLAGIMVAVGLVLVVVFHLFEPQLAKPITKKIYS